jgi:hypothetical protein
MCSIESCSLKSQEFKTSDWQMKMWSDYVLKNLATGYFRQAEGPEPTVEKYDDKFKGSPEIQYGKSKEDWEFTAESLKGICLAKLSCC